MWADTEGQVSAPTREVSIGGNSSPVAAIGLEQNSVNKNVMLVDESSGEALVMDSLLVCQGSSVLPTLVHHDEMMASCVVGANSQVTVCGNEEENNKRKEVEKKKIERYSSTTDSLFDCLGDHPIRPCGLPCNRVTMRGDEADNREDFHQGKGDGSTATDVTHCVDVDQLASACHAEGKAETDSCTDTVIRATRKSGTRRRMLPKVDGSYVNGLLNGLEVTYTVDPAATETMIAPWIFEQIPEEIRPKLQPHTEGSASGAGGGNIRVWGKGIFELQLGPVRLEREALVAEITDEILLGDDIIRRDPEGPMDIINSRKVMLFREQEIPIVTVGLPKRALRVSVLDDEIIPGMTEKIIDAFIHRPDDDTYDTIVEESMLVEADPDFVKANRCLVTPVVVRATGWATTKIRVFNPYAEPTFLKGNAVLGELVPVDVKKVLREAEHPDEIRNKGCMRRVRVKRRTIRQAKRVVRQARKVQQTTSQETDDTVPTHIEDLIERSSEGWTAKEQVAIKKLLIQFQDVFSKNEFDLGNTQLVEHTINTGDAKPIAQPPRRVPLAFAEAEKKQIGKMLETGVVRPSTSPWASPVCLVRKPDGSARVCIDFRGLNAVTMPIQQPIPRTEDCLDSLAGGQIFSVCLLANCHEGRRHT